ncbi:MAG: hypothetical protein MI757_01690 [Pirellulales bacterium]|nr:hypothetical protein [Pirellulales bacterium]
MKIAVIALGIVLMVLGSVIATINIVRKAEPKQWITRVIMSDVIGIALILWAVLAL